MPVGTLTAGAEADRKGSAPQFYNGYRYRIISDPDPDPKH